MSNQHPRPPFPPRGYIPRPNFFSRFQLQPRFFGIIGSRPNQPPVNQAGRFPGLPAQTPWLQPGQQPPFPTGFHPQRPPGDYHPSAGSPIDMNFWTQRAAQFNQYQQQQMAYQQASSYYQQTGYYPYNQYPQQPRFASPGHENEAEHQSTVVIEDVSSPSPPPGVRLYERNGGAGESDGQQADAEAGGVEGILVDLGDGSDGQGSSGTESHVDRFLFEDGYQSQAESVQSPRSMSSSEGERQQPATVQQQMPERSPGQDKKEASKSPAPDNKQESGKKKSDGGAVPKRRPTVIPIETPPCVHSLPVTPTGSKNVHFPDFSAISLPTSPTADSKELPSIFHKEPNSTWVPPQQRNSRRSRAQMNKLARNPYGYIRGFHGEDPNAVDLNAMDFNSEAVEKPRSRNRAAQYKQQQMMNKGSKAAPKNIKKQPAIVPTPIKGNNKQNNYGRFIQRNMPQAAKVTPATGKEAAIQMETPPPTPVTPEETWPELTSVNVPKREADGNKWRRELMLTEETATPAPETPNDGQKVDEGGKEAEEVADVDGQGGEALEPAEPALITAEANSLAENSPNHQEEPDNAAAQASTPEPQVLASAAASGDDHDFFVTPPPNLDDAHFCLPPRFLAICSKLDPNDVLRLSSINEAYDEIKRQFYLLGANAIDRTAFTKPEGESWTPEKPKPVVENTAGGEGGATASEALIETLENMSQVYRVPANDGSPSWIPVGQALANEGRPTPRMNFSKFLLETLFYQFYVLCATPVQLLAAHELHRRGWRFHKRWQLWIISSDETPVSPPENYVYLPHNNPFTTIRDILYFDQRIWDFVFLKSCRVNFMELELERPAIEHLTYMHHPFPLFTDGQQAGAA